MTVTLSDVEINGKYYEEIDAEVEFNYFPEEPEERWGYHGATPGSAADVEILSVKVDGADIKKQLDNMTLETVESACFEAAEEEISSNELERALDAAENKKDYERFATAW